MNLQDAYRNWSQANKANGPWSRIRANGFSYFSKYGLPTKKNEEWKYTSLKALTEIQLVPAPVGKPTEFEKIKTSLNPNFYNLVFVDGKFSKSLSSSDLNKEKCLAIQDLRNGKSVLAKIQRARKLAAPIRQDALEALSQSRISLLETRSIKS